MDLDSISSGAWITVSEASASSGVSQRAIYDWIESGKVRSRTIEEVRYVNSDDIAAQYWNSISRRAFFKKTAKVIGSIVTAGISGWGLFMWDRWASDRSHNARIEIGQLFSEWNDINLVPGTAHPQFGFHPDIVEAQDKLIKLIHKDKMKTEFRSLVDLPAVDRNRNLLLIGGPISNRTSREWQGFMRDQHSGTLTRSRRHPYGLRWEFLYPSSKNYAMQVRRYVCGQLVSTSQKFIEDAQATHVARERCGSVDAETGKLTGDVLLISYLPNILSASSEGNAIVDVADLHGQGDKAFARILQEDSLRLELYEATRKRGFRFFQALYEVPVYHQDDIKHTDSGNPRLIDVFRLA
jgi:hypothetical protein